MSTDCCVFSFFQVIILYVQCRVDKQHCYSHVTCYCCTRCLIKVYLTRCTLTVSTTSGRTVSPPRGKDFNTALGMGLVVDLGASLNRHFSIGILTGVAETIYVHVQ